MTVTVRRRFARTKEHRLPEMSPNEPTDISGRTDPLPRNLRERSVRGGAIVLASQACKFLIALSGLAVLARLLAPEDFGLLGMAVVVTGFLVLFKDLGLAMATIQRADITHEQISTLFWINVGAGVSIMLLTMALAPALAWFYGEPRLVVITLTLAGAFVFGGLSVQHLALLRRQMRFGAVAYVEIAAQLFSIIVAVVLAWRFRTYWALVAMHVTLPATTAAGVWIACRWRPGRPMWAEGVRPLLAYGGHQTGFSVVNYFTRNLDNALIGWRFGAGALGVYREAYRLLLLPIAQLSAPATHVALAALSRLQYDPDRFRAYYCRGIELMVTCSMPVVAFLFVSADHVVLTVLGDQWLGAVTIFRVLGPAAFLGSFNVATGWVHSSLGRVDRKFRWGLFVSIVSVIGFVISLRWGPIGVAASVSIVTCTLRIPGLMYAYHRTPIRLGDLGSVIWRPAAAALLGAAMLFGIRYSWRPEAPPAVLLFLEGAMYTVCYIGVWVLLPNGRQKLTGVLRLLKEMRGNGPQALVPHRDNPE